MKSTFAKYVFTIVSVSATIGPQIAFAVAQDCSEIKNATKRLQCFDIQAKGNSTKLHESEAQRAKQAEEEKKKEQVERAVQERKAAELQAIAAYKALKKLSVQIDTGLSYTTYVPALAEAKFAVSEFLDGPNKNILPEVAKRLELALTHYEFVNTALSIKYSPAARKQISNTVLSMNVVFDKRLENAMREEYPNMSQATSKYSDRYLDYDKAVNVIFDAATKELAVVREMLPQ